MTVEALYVFSLVFLSLTAATRFVYREQARCVSGFLLEAAAGEAARSDARFETAALQAEALKERYRPRLDSLLPPGEIRFRSGETERAAAPNYGRLISKRVSRDRTHVPKTRFVWKLRFPPIPQGGNAMPKLLHSAARSFLALPCTEDAAPHFALRMLEENSLPGFLPLRLCGASAENELCYEVSGLHSLSEVCRGQALRAAELRHLLLHLLHALSRLPAYLLSSDGVLLQSDCVYLESLGRAPRFLYHPGQQRPFSETLSAFFTGTPLPDRSERRSERGARLSSLSGEPAAPARLGLLRAHFERKRSGSAEGGAACPGKRYFGQ